MVPMCDLNFLVHLPWKARGKKPHVAGENRSVNCLVKGDWVLFDAHAEADVSVEWSVTWP